jgi:Ca-activated chloride channel family protein
MRSWPSRPTLAASLAALALAACAGQSASYTRFRRAADTGRTMASSEVRVQDFVDRFAQEDAAPALLASADATALYVDARVANPHLPPRGGRALVGVTLRGVPRSVRAPAELVVVIDVSGSMNEAGKIEAVRHALARMVETLDPQDHVALVTFADEAHVALPMTSVGAARPVVLGAVSSLTADGGTNLHAGLVAAMGLVRSSRPLNTRVLVLSDGMATVGVTDPDAIVRSVAPLRQARVPITTVGVGDAIDFSLLEALAAERGGFQYVDQPAEVERVFATYVRSLSEVSAREVEIRVGAPAGGRVLRAFDERARVEGGEARVSTGDFGGSDAYVGLFEVEVPPGFSPASIPIEVRFDTLDGGERLALRRDAPFGYDGAGDYALVDEREPGLFRAATMGYAAIGLREAALASERGDAAGAEGWLRSTLLAVEAARGRLAANDPARAASLDEPLALVRRTHADAAARIPSVSVTAAPAVAAPTNLYTPPSSAAFAGWR